MQRGLWALCALCAAGCATTPSVNGSQPVSQQQRITNNSYFDLANCFPQDVKLPAPATTESLVGFLVLARPQLNECLVDPKHRGPDATTQATIEATVDATGVTYEVTGTNLTPEGQACLERAMQARGGIEPLPEGSKPVTGKIDFHHAVGQSPSVIFGQNEANDVAGTVRLALPGWCDCFQPWATSVPSPMGAKLTLVKDTPTPTAVAFNEPARSGPEAEVQQCLTQKLSALQLPHTSEQLTVPVWFLTIHSGVAEPLQTDRSELQILQLDAIRARSAAQVAMALGARANAAQTWSDMVAKYQANNRAYTLKELREGCGNLLAADDALLAALEQQRANEQRTLEFVQAQAAKAPAWRDAVDASTKQVQAATTEIENTKKLRAEDEQGCPKVRY